MFPNFHYTKLATMDEEAAAAATRTRPEGKSLCKRVAILYGMSFCVLLFIFIIIILLWAVRSGRYNTPYYHFAFPSEPINILLSYIFWLSGCAIIGDLAEVLDDKLRQPEETGTHQEFTRIDKEATRETKMTCKVFARIFLTVISLFILLRGVYNGYRLATKPRGDSHYNQITPFIGVIYISFGLVYFFTGLAILRLLVVSTRFVWLGCSRKRKETGIQ